MDDESEKVKLNDKNKGQSNCSKWKWGRAK